MEISEEKWKYQKIFLAVQQLMVQEEEIYGN